MMTRPRWWILGAIALAGLVLIVLVTGPTGIVFAALLTLAGILLTVLLITVVVWLILRLVRSMRGGGV